MMKAFLKKALEGLICVCFVLVLQVSQSWSAEPTLARLGFWVPPERMTEFEAAYGKQLVPLLKQHGFKTWAGPARATVDSVFARLFELTTPSDVALSKRDFLADPKVREVLRNLGSAFGTNRSDGMIKVDAHIYKTPAGSGTQVFAGDGQGHWRTYDLTDGLAGNMTVSIYQDGEGYIWFATNGGLSRYDGKTFTKITTDNGLFKGGVSKVYQDREGVFWFGIASGVVRYDGKTFEKVTMPKSFGGRGVLAIYQDRDGFLWFGANGGTLCRYNPSHLEELTPDSGRAQFNDFTGQEGLSKHRIVSIAQDRDGVFWFGTNGGGVSRYDGKTFTTLMAKDGLAHNRIRAGFMDRDGVHWYGTIRGVSRYDGKTFTNFTAKDGLTSNNIRAIYQDRDGFMWFGTWSGGVSRYNPLAALGASSPIDAAKDSISQVFTTFNKSDGLGFNGVSAIYQDREGVFWFGTFTNGVSRFDREAFTGFTTQNGLGSNRIWRALHDREGNIWFSTASGVSRYDGKSFTTFTAQDGLANSNIFSAFQDRDGDFWFGTFDGLTHYDGETFTTYTTMDGLAGNNMGQAIQDREGNLWFGSSTGLTRYDGETFTAFTKQDELNHRRLHAPFQDREGMFWFGISDGGGIGRYDGQNWTTFTTKDGLVHNNVGKIFQDRDGALWFATRSGVSRYDGQNWETFTTDDGLAVNSVWSFFQDSEGTFWFGTFGGGVSRYDGQVWSTLTTKDGLISNSISEISQGKDGAIWFTTDAGVMRYRPPLPTPPPVFIDAVIADRRYEGVSDIAIPSSVSLTTFEFHGSSFKTRPEAMIYRYRLKGYDNAWKNTHSRRVEYENLPRGTYTFEVLAVDRDLVYSEAPAMMTVNVHWPYERMGWMSSLGIALLLIGWQATRIVRRDQRLREANVSLSESNASLEEANGALSNANHELFGLNQELQEKTKDLELASAQAQQANQAKSRFLASMSHELRTPLNGILGYAQVLDRDKRLDEKQRDGVGIIRRSGEHLLGLINDVLDLARIEAEKVELEEKEIGLPAFLKNVSAISGVKAQEKGLVFVYDAPSDLPEVVRGDPRRLRQVLLNLLGNAAKFTEQGEIRFLVRVVSHTEDMVRLRFEVQDTGAGMTESEAHEVFKPFEQAGGSKQRAQGTGLGLAISQQLVGLMGGEIQVESTPGTGSRFWFEANFGSTNGQTEVTVQDERVPVGFNGESRQVLVVDDRVENRAVLISLLEPLGFKVTEAENGQVGLDLAVKMQPDLILLDLVMPVLDGFEATRRLRKIDALKDIVVIALSASVFEQERRQSLEAGCTDFLPKPVEAEDLLEKISQHLDLEWTYDADDDVPVAVMNGEMVMPPADALKPLFDVAQKGQIFALDEQIGAIAQLGEEFGPFVTHVQTLAKDFKVDQICRLIKPHLGGQDDGSK